MIPSNYRYSNEHEWVKLEGDIATVGITSHAANELGEIVFVELPKVGAEIGQMAEFGSVESVKTVSSLFLPITGVVTEINEDLLDNPGRVNSSPYEDGWMVKVRVTDNQEYDDLMTSEEYKGFLETL